MREKNRRPKVLASNSLAHSWRLDVVEDRLKFPGKPSFLYARVIVPESVVVIAKRRDERIPLVRQYRHGARGSFWELPAGYLEKDESALECVKREFKEEVGHELERPRKINAFYLQPSRSNQIVHVFAGRVGRFDPAPKDATESIDCRFFSMPKVKKLLWQKPSAMHVLALSLVEYGV